jgi:hypothetical protein
MKTPVGHIHWADNRFYWCLDLYGHGEPLTFRLRPYKSSGVLFRWEAEGWHAIEVCTLLGKRTIAHVTFPIEGNSGSYHFGHGAPFDAIRVRVQSSAFASGPWGVLRRIALDACDVGAPSGWKIACTAD